jgi:hypothetical protein
MGYFYSQDQLLELLSFGLVKQNSYGCRGVPIHQEYTSLSHDMVWLFLLLVRASSWLGLAQDHPRPAPTRPHPSPPLLYSVTMAQIM